MGARVTLPPAVRALIVARAVNRLGAFTLPFLALLLINRLHATTGQAGLLLAGFGLATIPSRLAGGRLSDRLGVRATVLLGLGGTAAAQLAIAGAQTLTQAAVAVIALGLAFEVYEPASQSMIADATPAELHPAAFGLLSAAMAAAGIGAGLLAIWVAGLDLRWLFVIDAATCLACAVAMPRIPRVPPPARPPLGADRRLLAMLATGIVFAIVYLQATIALPLTLTARGEPAGRLGLLLTVSALTIVAGQPLLKIRARDHFSAMTLGYLVLGVGQLALGFCTSLPAFAAATVVCGVGDLILLGRAYSIVAALAPAGASGRYLATYGIGWGIAAVAAPIIGTQLLAYGGPVLVWSTCAGACLALAAAQPLLRRHIDGPP
jgi:MFS family permease